MPAFVIDSPKILCVASQKLTGKTLLLESLYIFLCITKVNPVNILSELFTASKYSKEKSFRARLGIYIS